MLIVFQILFFLFALGAIAGVHRRYMHGELSSRASLFWSAFWLAAAIVVFLPETAARLAALFGIGRGVDFILYISVAALFFVIFRLHVKLEMIQRDITKVVRDKALKEHT